MTYFSSWWFIFWTICSWPILTRTWLLSDLYSENVNTGANVTFKGSEHVALNGIVQLHRTTLVWMPRQRCWLEQVFWGPVFFTGQLWWPYRVLIMYVTSHLKKKMRKFILSVTIHIMEQKLSSIVITADILQRFKDEKMTTKKLLYDSVFLRLQNF